MKYLSCKSQPAITVTRISNKGYHGSLKSQMKIIRQGINNLSDVKLINSYKFIESGYNSDFRYFQKLVSEIRTLPIGTKICIRSNDRLCRNVGMLQYFKTIIKYYNSDIIVVNKKCTESQAQNYSRLLSSKLKDKAQIPYGYTLKRKKLVVTTSKRKLKNIHLILNYSKTEYSINELSQITNLPNETIIDIIQNQIYTGGIDHKERKVEPMIDKKTYRRNVMKKKAQLFSISKQVQYKKVMCGKCRRSFSRNKSGKYFYLQSKCNCVNNLNHSELQIRYQQIPHIYFKKQIVNLLLLYLQDYNISEIKNVRQKVNTFIATTYLQFENSDQKLKIINDMDPLSYCLVYNQKIQIKYNILTCNDSQKHQVDRSLPYTDVSSEQKKQFIYILNKLGHLMSMSYKTEDDLLVIKKDVLHKLNNSKNISIPESIKSDYPSLSSDKQLVLSSKSKNILTLAYAGTGKTYLLKEYSNKFLRDNPNGKILYLTFSNRLCNQFSGNSSIEKMTFHKLAFRILLGNGDMHSYVKLNNSKALRQMKKTYHNNSIKMLIKTLRQMSSTGYCIQYIVEQNKMPTNIVKIYHQFLTLQEEYQEQYLSSVIYDACELLQSDQRLREQIRNKYDLILLDEIQDMNLLQNKLVSLIYNGRIHMVGDPFQCIYGFLGSSQSNIYRLANELKIQEVFQMNENHRSSEAVVQYMNKYMNGCFREPDAFTGIIAMKDSIGSVQQIEVSKNMLNQTISSLIDKYSQLVNRSNITILSHNNKTINDLVVQSDIQQMEWEWEQEYDYDDHNIKSNDEDQYSTIHGYKGLQNKVIVYIVDRDDFDSYKEKVNLKYTAFSRAEQHLVIVNIKEES